MVRRFVSSITVAALAASGLGNARFTWAQGASSSIVPVAIPATPAGRVLKAWLDAFNSGDSGQIDAYYRKYQPSKSAGSEMEFRKETGGFDLSGILINQPLRVEFQLKERRSGMPVRGRLTVTDATPSTVTRLSLSAIPPGATLADFTIDRGTRTTVIDGAIANLEEYYVFPDVAARMADTLRARQKRGDYDLITDGETFADTLTAELLAISHDKHLGVTFTPARLPDAPQGPDPNGPAAYRTRMESLNCRFDRVERLPGNIGYLKFDGFPDPDVCGATAIAAMTFLGNVDALIIDLRTNGGGDPAMVALMATYLFDQPTHLNDLWERKTNTTRQFWTLPYVPGKRLTGRPVYVLTSKRTFSGAEEFTYDLQMLKRATVIGEATGGGAHPVMGHRIDDHFMIGVPFARAINPISKTNWEGVGVEPDIKVPAADALSTAEKLAGAKVAANPGSLGPAAAAASATQPAPR